nr:MAG TPA: hypothetical protein [Caudoviricetes sp.]
MPLVYREGDRPSRSGRRKRFVGKEIDRNGNFYQCFIQCAGCRT